jgi:hypothetical protein
MALSTVPYVHDSNPAQSSNVKHTGRYFKSRSGYRFSEINIFRWQDDTRFAKIALTTVPYVYWFRSGLTVNPGSTFNYIAEWCWNRGARANVVQRQIIKRKKLGFWYCVLFRSEKRKTNSLNAEALRKKNSERNTLSPIWFSTWLLGCADKNRVSV